MKKLALASVAVLALSFTNDASAASAKKEVPAHSHHESAYTEFPPRNAEGNVIFHPEMYEGDPGKAYYQTGDSVYWYPGKAGEHPGVPFFFDGQTYWYAASTAPNAVYTSGVPVAYLIPHPKDKPMDDAVGSPMEKTPLHAPEIK